MCTSLNNIKKIIKTLGPIHTGFTELRVSGLLIAEIKLDSLDNLVCIEEDGIKLGEYLFKPPHFKKICKWIAKHVHKLKITKVLRVQDGESCGPYTNMENGDILNGNKATDRHPTPRKEGLMTGYCCFSSIEQLKSWFDGFTLEKLRARGYRVVLLSVHETALDKGAKQCTIQDNYFNRNLKN